MDLQVWVGCLAHYNNGDLIGEWVDASDAPAWVCPKKNPNDIYINCEETWIRDHEIPWVRGEMDPVTAGKWAEAVAWVEEHQVEAFTAWLQHVVDGDIDLDEVTEDNFMDAYQGQYEKPEDHAYELVEEAYNKFSMTFFTLTFNETDWEQDYTFTPGGHVFWAH
jgi:antirestriction protein